MRVCFLTGKDPKSIWAWSGLISSMYRALEAAGLDVQHVGGPQRSWRDCLRGRLRRLASPSVQDRAQSPDEILAEARETGRRLSRLLKDRPCDVIFAPVSAREIPFVETDVPIVYLSDATARLMRTYYPDRGNMSSLQLDALEECERRAIERADACVFSSDWAAESAIRDYGKSLDRVHAIPFGPNLRRVPNPSDLIARPCDRCRLLFVGRDWQRKGGPVAAAAVRTLRNRGIEAELLVCGATPPPEDRGPGITVLGILDKSRRRDYVRYEHLLRTASFMFVPSRADCTPTVFCEAAAFGLPSLSTQTGGIPTVVSDGQSGRLLPADARSEDFADVIGEAYEDPAVYRAMCEGARRTYEQRLNWGVWGCRVRGLMESCAGLTVHHLLNEVGLQ